jgi:hypothetical protein
MSVPLRCLVLSRFEQSREMKSTDAREIASGLAPSFWNRSTSNVAVQALTEGWHETLLPNLSPNLTGRLPLAATQAGGKGDFRAHAPSVKPLACYIIRILS